MIKKLFIMFVMVAIAACDKPSDEEGSGKESSSEAVAEVSQSGEMSSTSKQISTRNSSAPDSLTELLGKNIAFAKLKDLNGKPRRLTQLPGRGRARVINVWATWCTPCVRELPALNALASEGRYDVIAIATDKDVEAVKKFIGNKTLGHIMFLWDPNGAEMRAKYNANQLPMTYIVSPNWSIRQVDAGEREWDTEAMKAQIEDAVDR